MYVHVRIVFHSLVSLACRGSLVEAWQGSCRRRLNASSSAFRKCLRELGLVTHVCYIMWASCMEKRPDAEITQLGLFSNPLSLFFSLYNISDEFDMIFPPALSDWMHSFAHRAMHGRMLKLQGKGYLWRPVSVLHWESTFHQASLKPTPLTRGTQTVWASVELLNIRLQLNVAVYSRHLIRMHVPRESTMTNDQRRFSQCLMTYVTDSWNKGQNMSPIKMLQFALKSNKLFHLKRL